MIRPCPFCGAVLGPSESAAGCLTCRGGGDGSNRDAVVAVLERSERPLPHWDVKRILERDQGYRVADGSILAWLADPRACWGGKGIYGLYRHGLLPGVRDLGAAASVFLYATERILHHSELWFAMRYAGYQAEEASVYYALRRAATADLVHDSWTGWRRPPRNQLPLARLKRSVGARGRDFELVIERAGQQVEAALAERSRRLRDET